MNKDITRKKLIIATFFSVLFFAVWNVFVVKPLMQKQNVKSQNKIEEIKKENEVIIEKNDKNLDSINSIATSTKEEIVVIENDYILGGISTRGLKFDNIYLKKYKKTINSNDFIQLLNKDYFINFGFLSNDIKVPNENTVWSTENIKLTQENPVIFAYDNGENAIFKVIISLDDKYMFNVEQVVENKTDKHIYVKPFAEIRKKDEHNKKNKINNTLRISGVFNNKLEEIKAKKLNSRNFEFEKFNWFMISDKYWSTSIISNNSEDIKVNFLKDNDIFKAQYISNKDINIKPNSSFSFKNYIYTGAKELSILDGYQEKLNIPLFDRTVDFGFLYILTKPMYLILRFFYNLFGNLGLAILALTIFVKLAMYPSTKKSFISMAKMKKVQPEMTRIQNQYKNDKIMLNQKLMKLYKDNNINPLSGCLPMLLQLPIFLALYRVFIVAIEMRHAPFFGYLKDLSSADPTSIFNLFGLLPFDTAFKLGFLPCLTALTMWIQQKINEKQTPNDPNNPMTASLKYMPLMFLFLFSSFPSGLLLYWIFSNIISIIQQLWINRLVEKTVKIS